MTRQVLVVDDSRSARLMLRKLLERCGVEVLQAESGEQALELMQHHTPGLVFMDHMMPGMGGLQTTEKITQQDPSPMVVMCTSNDGDEYLKQAKAHGAADILVKPASLASVRSMLARYPSAVTHHAAQSANQPVIQPIVATVASEIESEVAMTDSVINPPKKTAQASAPVQATLNQDELDAQVRVLVQDRLEHSIPSLTQRISQSFMQVLQHEINQSEQAISSSLSQKIPDSDKLKKELLQMVNQSVKKQIALELNSFDESLQRRLETIDKRLDEPRSLSPKAVAEIHKISENAGRNVAEDAATAAGQLAGGDIAKSVAQTVVVSQMKSIKHDLSSEVASGSAQSKMIGAFALLVALGALGLSVYNLIN
ncbi:response regulator [Pelagibaculum spongiae]|uniref:Response regulatory domain-containing protein n=1 Tax=Pelagibaculum spongiae TaxID=2080658 RepID=A0A2V1GXM9_9GAMM|nr:response regulator [Pelagibaculum spongiae]PVZ69024.1 hypothetical protein DC094_12385 [Pelagibaculum spongiae]